jgi:hypothetical protein
MITKCNNRWVYINSIDGARALTRTRRAVVTPMFKLRNTGGIIVHFPDAPRPVLASSVIDDGLIVETPVVEVPKRVNVQRGVHNSVQGEVTGHVIQSGSIDGKSVSDFLRGE